jgi:hypothetical protein
MLTLTHQAKNKWLLRGHSELNQKHSNFDILIISIGIYLSDHCQPRYTVYRIQNCLSRKKLGSLFPKV